MARRVVITGGAGFVGSQLGRTLRQAGHQVLLVDNMSYGHLENLVDDAGAIAAVAFADVRDANIVRHFEGADVVFHFAGIAALPACQTAPQHAFDVNLSGTANVLEASRLAGVQRVIFSSTSAVYEANSKLPNSVSDSVAPNLIYAMSKKAAEDVCRAYAVNYGMDVVVCRFFNVYGPHQDMRRLSPPFTSYVARELAMGRRPRLFNKSAAKRDYVHTDDVIRLLEKMMTSDRGFAAEVFNIGSGVAHAVPELYEIFRRVSGVDLEPEWAEASSIWDQYPALFDGKPLSRVRIEKEVYKESLADIDATVDAFDWTPEIDIESGLASVWRYAVDLVGSARGA